METLSGCVVVDKPLGWTSHDVVNRVRRLAGTKKVGHLGTLDPNASGVLPLLVGRATRLAQYFGRAEKRYEGVVRFGFATDTYDAVGKPVGEPVECSFTTAQVEEALNRFRGRFLQTPPPVSAKKVSGVPAYKLARENRPVELPPVEVEIHLLELLYCTGSEAGIRVHCSTGTYVRSIAHDLGAALGCGAHLHSLRRTASGVFDISAARTLEQLGELQEQGRFEDAIIPPGQLLTELPAEHVDTPTVAFIRQGRAFRLNPFRPVPPETRYVRAIGPDGDLVAIGEVKMPQLAQPVLVL